MIDQRSQQIAVMRLIPEVEALSPADLETVSVCLLRAIEGRDFIHRGLNEEGRPTKATVDAFNDEGDVTLEVGSEKGYFSDPFEKVSNDVRHAIRLRPDTQQIYLCSSRALRNSDEPGVQKAASDAANGCKVTVYCQRRLAEKIYEYSITKDTLWEALEFFFPSLRELREVHALTHSHPSVPAEAVGRDDLVVKLAEVLQRVGIVYIHGMSGMGKTWVARQLIGTVNDKYDSILWLDPGEFDDHSDLKGIRIARFGQSLNLMHRLTDAHCLLVIDDLRTGLQGLLTQISGTNSHCIVTSQLAPDTVVPDGSTCLLPSLGRESINSVLRPGNILDEQIVETIWRKTGGHPLSLAIIRDTATAEGVSYQHIAREIDTLPDWEDAATAVTIIDRVLSRHSASVARELGVLKWLGSRQIDPRLLLAMGTLQSVGKLRRRSFVTESVSGLLTLHDILLTCLSHYAPEPGGTDPAQSFWKYFEDNWWTAPYHFRRSVQLHADKFTHWRTEHDATPCIQEYVGLLAENSGAIESARLAVLLDLDFAPFANNDVALFCLVEAHEFACRQIHGDERVVPAELAIEKIDAIIDGLQDGQTCANLHHHRGKFLRYAKRYPEMEQAFETALSMDPTAYQAHLQLARIAVRKKQWDNARAHIEAILEAYINDDLSVAITLVLDVFAMLGHQDLRPLLTKYIANDPILLRKALTFAGVQGYSQPFATVARLSKQLYYSAPALVSELSQHFDVPAPGILQPDEAFQIAEFLKGKAKAEAETHSEEVSVKQWGLIVDYYQAADVSQAYQKQMYAECLNGMGRFAESIAILETENLANATHWFRHRYAEALLGVGRLEEALTQILLAIDGLSGLQYRSTYLNVKARIWRRRGMLIALDTLRDAIDVCDNEKYRSRLSSTLTLWQAGSCD